MRVRAREVKDWIVLGVVALVVVGMLVGGWKLYDWIRGLFGGESGRDVLAKVKTAISAVNPFSDDYARNAEAAFNESTRRYPASAAAVYDPNLDDTLTGFKGWLYDSTGVYLGLAPSDAYRPPGSNMSEGYAAEMAIRAGHYGDLPAARDIGSDMLTEVYPDEWR